MTDKPAVAPTDDAPAAPPSATPADVPAPAQKNAASESLYSPWIRGATTAILVKRARLGVRS